MEALAIFNFNKGKIAGILFNINQIVSRNLKMVHPSRFGVCQRKHTAGNGPFPDSNITAENRFIIRIRSVFPQPNREGISLELRKGLSGICIASAGSEAFVFLLRTAGKTEKEKQNGAENDIWLDVPPFHSSVYPAAHHVLYFIMRR